MASHVECKPHVKDFSSIPVEAEFPNVFPDKFPRFPPKRNAEFSIDLVSTMTPI